MARRHFTFVTGRPGLPRWPLPAVLLAALAGCATAPPAAAPDRYSPAEMRRGPSLYETGHVAVVPPSSGGLRIDEGRIDRVPPAARDARPRPPAAARAHAKRRVRASQAR